MSAKTFTMFMVRRPDIPDYPRALCMRAVDVRYEVGRWFSEDWEQGWETAKGYGWRVVKVRVTVEPVERGEQETPDAAPKGGER